MFALLVNGMPMGHCERTGVFYSIVHIKLNAHIRVYTELPEGSFIHFTLDAFVSSMCVPLCI